MLKVIALTLVGVATFLSMDAADASQWYGAPYGLHRANSNEFGPLVYGTVQDAIDAWVAQSGTPSCNKSIYSQDPYKPAVYDSLYGVFAIAAVYWPCGSDIHSDVGEIYGTTYYDYQPEINLGNETCPWHGPSNLCGNPINVSTGNKFQIEEDIPVAGNFGFVRYYNSSASALTEFDGAHWSNTYTRRIDFLQGREGDDSYATSATATILRPDGKRLVFSLVDGTWVPQFAGTGTLTQIEDSSGARLGWTFSEVDAREVETFDALGRLISIESDDGGKVTLIYNNGVISNTPNDRELTSVLAQNGRSLSFSYTNNRLHEMIDSNGGHYLYSYDASANLTSVAYPGGNTKTYLYNESANTNGASLPNALTGIQSEDLQRFATFHYQSDGKAVSTDHGGDIDKFSVVYNSNGSVSITEPSGDTDQRSFVSTFGVRKPNSRVQSCGSCGTQSSSFTYDSNGYPDIATDARSVTVDHDYDWRGLEIQRVEAANDSSGSKRTIETDWDPLFAVPTERRIRKSDGTLVARQTWSINARGQVLSASSIDPATSTTRTITTTYCEQADIDNATCPIAGLVKAIDGPRTDTADVTSFTYYQTDDASCTTAPTTCPHRKGDLWKVTNALGQVTETLRYDGAGRVLSMKDPNAVVTDFEYSPRGWLTARKVRGINNASEADDQITQIEYWPTGLVKKVTQPDGSFTSYTYDAAHRLTDITDNAGNSIHYTLDNAGNRTTEDTKDPSGTIKRTLSRIYNALSQLQAQSDAGGHPTGFTYDANGNSDQITDPRGHVTDNDYDPLDRLSKTVQDLGGVAPSQTSFGYDALDNLIKVTDPKGLDTTYTYNGLSELKTVSSPDTGTTNYYYDTGGNRQSQIDARSITTTYSYDALNRLTSVSYPTLSLTTYTYDTPGAVCQTGETFGKGRLAKFTDASGSTSYCYGRFGDLLRKVQVTNSKVFTVRYGYDRAGRMISLTYPDGTVADYVRDALGHISETGLTRPSQPRVVVMTSATYAPFGPSTGWAYTGGRTLARSLDQDYRPMNVFDGSAGGLSLSFGFDPAGNLDTLKDGLQSQTLARYRYDGLNRLDQTQDGPTGIPIETYTYNTTGDRLSTTVNPNSTTNYTYPAANHRLIAVGGVARVPDANGNTTSIGGTAKVFRFNDANRMDRVSASGTVTINYVYNGKGEQVRRYLGTTNSYTVYDEVGHWLGDYDGTGAPVQQAVWMDDLPVGLTADKLYYVEPDHLGTPRAVIDPTRNVAVWRWDLDGEAFGTTAPNQDPDLDSTNFVFNLRYPGQRYDSASELNYNYFRDYDSATGRYTESDPIGLNGGASTYAYVGDSAFERIDPFGLDWLEYTGHQINLYGGKSGDRSKIIRQCRASSGQNVPGYFDYRNSAYQNVPGYGPTPEGRYSVNLVPDPNRMANVSNGYLTPSPGGGIERIPAGGEQSWGTWRARLNPSPGTNTYGREYMYLHDSSKGETHGCIETCSNMLNNLIQLRSAGVGSIDVLVDYPGFISTGP